MKKLMVSHNCGTSYHEYARAEDASDFAEKINKAEADGLRWYIENDDGTIYFTHVSSIHRKTIEFIDSLVIAKSARHIR